MEVRPRPRGRRLVVVNKTLRAFDPHRGLLLPPSQDDWVPEDYWSRFVADLDDEVLDIRQSPGNRNLAKGSRRPDRLPVTETRSSLVESGSCASPETRADVGENI